MENTVNPEENLHFESRIDLSLLQEKVIAIEIDKNDFPYFYDKRMISIKQADLRATLDKYSRQFVADINNLISTGNYKGQTYNNYKRI